MGVIVTVVLSVYLSLYCASGTGYVHTGTESSSLLKTVSKKLLENGFSWDRAGFDRPLFTQCRVTWNRARAFYSFPVVDKMELSKFKNQHR